MSNAKNSASDGGSEGRLIAVIGGGVSGLLAAGLLVAAGERVILLEASNRLGGRVLGCGDLVPGHTFDLGAELVHGDDNIFFKLAQENNWELEKVVTWAPGDGEALPVKDGKAFFWLGKEQVLIDSITMQQLTPTVEKEKEDDIRVIIQETERLLDTLHSLEDLKGKIDPALTLKEYLMDVVGISHPTVLDLAEAGYGNTICCPLNAIRMNELVRIEKRFMEEGTGEFHLKNGIARTLIPYLQRRVPTFRLNWEVKRISWSMGQPITITNQRNEKITGVTHVILTPTPEQIKKISFNPVLPLKLSSALRSFHLFPAAKLFIVFSERIWPINSHGVICSNCLFPEFWFSCLPEENAYVACAFSTSVHAENILALGEEEAVRAMLKQMDQMFGGATRTYMRHFLWDWSAHPYIGGGYSSTNVPWVVRKELMKPVAGRLFLAGEAAWPSYMTIIGALNSGARAANSILTQIGKPTRDPVQLERDAAQHSRL